MSRTGHLPLHISPHIPVYHDGDLYAIRQTFDELAEWINDSVEPAATGERLEICDRDSS